MSSADVRRASALASVNGAWPSGVGIDAEHDVVHDRVADDDDVEQLVGGCIGLAQQIGDQLVERAADARRELLVASGVHHHERHPAHEVFAEPDLRVHHPGGRQHLTGRQIAEVAGHRGGPDVDRDAERSVDEARPDRNGNGVTVDGERDRALIVGSGAMDRTQHGGAPRTNVDTVRAQDGFADQLAQRLGVAEHGLRARRRCTA